MSDDNLVSNPLFGAVIGTMIGNNARAEGKQIVADSENRLLGRTVDALRAEVDAVTESELSLTCSIAGVRGVTRELLEELRKSDPKNPLLDKKVRDRVFDSSFNNTWEKAKGKTFQQRKPNGPTWRDETYGAKGATTGGPEKSQITPNLAVRAEAEVPSHVSDREKFLGLIERLAAEVKKNNPDAAILKDKAMVDAFEANITKSGLE